MKKKLHILTGITVVVVAVCSLAFASSAYAATITVSAGTDTIAADGVCHLSEAIENVNNQAQTHADCPAGTGNDIIQLPAGTITLSDNLPSAKKSVLIKGAGIGKSILDQAGSYAGLRNESQTTGMSFKFSDFTIRAISEGGLGFFDNDIQINRVELDGNGSQTGSALIGMMLGAGNSSTANIKIRDVYIHSFPDVSVFSTTGIMIGAEQNGKVNADVSNVTIFGFADSSSGGANGLVFMTGAAAQSFTPGQVTATVENLTVSNLTSSTSQANALGAIAAVNGGNTEVKVDATNVTIKDINGATDMLGVIGAASTALGAGDKASATLNISNSIIDGGCFAGPFAGFGESVGEATGQIVSNGGNISNNETCNDILNHEQDIINQTNLTDLLGTFGNHGGAVPTIPLLPGSSAIDGGVCDGAPSTDARGVSRPQGPGCDSGAFEVQQAAMASRNGISNAATGHLIFIDSPVTGAIVKSASVQPSSVAAGDSSHTYPFGLAGFTIEGVPSGSTQTVNVYFEAEEKAENFVLRKVNTSENKYHTIKDAVLSNETKNGKPVIKASYQITDGGELDLDGKADGVLVDPIGLAKQKSMLAKTGSVTITTSLLSALVIVGVVLVNRDYRKHKAPLAKIDKQLAKDYTIWHHVQVVTIPSLKYRVTLILEKKANT